MAKKKNQSDTFSAR